MAQKYLNLSLGNPPFAHLTHKKGEKTLRHEFAKGVGKEGL